MFALGVGKSSKGRATWNDVPVPVKYCPRCRTRYNDPPDVCRYCEIPGEEMEDQKTRVGILNRYLMLRVAWFGAWLLAGFFTAYLVTPDDAGEGMKLLIHIAFISATLILANLVLKIRSEQGPGD